MTEDEHTALHGDHAPAGYVAGLKIWPGDSIVYDQCLDPECKDHRTGLHHGHARVEHGK